MNKPASKVSFGFFNFRGLIPVVVSVILFGIAIPSVFSSSPASRMSLALQLESLFREFAPPAVLKDISAATRYPDLDARGHQEISAVLHRHLLKGYSTGEFRPKGSIHGDEVIRSLTQTLRHLQRLTSLKPEAVPFLATPLWAPRESIILKSTRVIPEDSVLWKSPGVAISEDELDQICLRMRDWLKSEADQASTPSTVPETASGTTSETDSATVSGQTLPEKTPTVLVLKGSVLDAISRSPIPQARLLVGKEHLTTDSEGSFSLADRKRDQIIDLLVTADGYQSLSIKHRVGFRKELCLLLKPRRASLKVTLSSSASGERVQAATASLGDKTITGSEVGVLDFGTVKPGYHRLNVQAPGFLPQEFLVSVEGQAVQRQFKLQPCL